MTPVEQMEAMRAENDALKAQVAGIAEKDAAIESAKSALESAIAERDAAIAERDAAKAETVAATDAAQKRIDELTAANAALQSELGAAKVKLANPAIADASAAGVAAGTAEGGEASEGVSLWAKYNAISNGAERTKFYRANKEAMDAEAGR